MFKKRVMEFYDHGLLSNQGSYGNVGKCTINGMTQIYKSLQDPTDYSLEIEQEASKRLGHQCFYRVNSLTIINGKKMLLMDAISGPILFNFMSEHNPELCMLQASHILAAIQLMHERGITHNDLHLGNILITKTEQKDIIYRLKKEVVTIETRGFRPVIIDFGLAFISNFRFRPSIVMSQVGNVCFGVFEPRFDTAKFLTYFTGELGRQAALKHIPRYRNLSPMVKTHITQKAGLDTNGFFRPGVFVGVETNAKALLRRFHPDGNKFFNSVIFSLFLSIENPMPLRGISAAILQAALKHSIAVFASYNVLERAILTKKTLESFKPSVLKSSLNRIAGLFLNFFTKHVNHNHALVKKQFDKMTYQTCFDWLLLFYPDVPHYKQPITGIFQHHLVAAPVAAAQFSVYKTAIEDQSPVFAPKQGPRPLVRQRARIAALPPFEPRPSHNVPPSPKVMTASLLHKSINAQPLTRRHLRAAVTPNKRHSSSKRSPDKPVLSALPIVPPVVPPVIDNSLRNDSFNEKMDWLSEDGDTSSDSDGVVS